MGKRRLVALLILSLAGLLAGCSAGKSNNTKESDYYLYYIDKDETKVVQEAYEPEANTTEDLIAEFVKALDQEPKNYSYRKAKPDTVVLKDYTYNGGGQLILNFETGYYDMEGIAEVLTRAAIVKSFCQIDGVDYVEFYVAGQPLRDKNEKPISMMTDENFIDNTGGETKYKQNAKISLFFANKSGNKLVESNVVVSYNGTIPMEQLIVEQLISGPLSDIKYPTIPEGTKLVKATVKEGICYVDFNEKFLEKINGITDEVAIYSVVNSLVEMPTINKVQFKINGELTKTYGESTAFDGMFERNLDVVETTQ
ncbi:GerMN domain-containing protein [Anaerosporobacter faecicola]|uniref:GerMN domain-containing protein n=1 Tax=Anaerosporobacter faecicola TaxID=2718714 RepID=UPI001438A0FC|nr:GerMN domain-containing protein [Anaerosporobacter faecicola]